MKILYVARYFWPTLGAASTGTFELATRLANLGNEVSLFVPNSSDPQMAKVPWPAFPESLTVSRSGPRLSRFPAGTLSFVFLGFRAFRAARGAHVILAQHHFGQHWASLCAAILSLIARRPLVIKAHDVFYPRENALQSILAILTNWVTQVSFRRAEQVLVPGEELVRMVQRVYRLDARKVRTLSNGVDTRKFGPWHRSDDLREKIGSKHIVVFCGSINLDSDASGLDVLLEATRVIRGEIPDVKVLVIGDGPDLPRVMQLADSLRLDDCVQFLGWVSFELIPLYLSSADVCVGLLRETIQSKGSTPLKMLEYMATGCVVLVCRGGCSQGLVVDGINGIIVESGSVGEVANSIMRVFSDEKLTARLGSRARKTAEALYDWEVIVSKLEETLRSTVEVRNPSVSGQPWANRRTSND